MAELAILNTTVLRTVANIFILIFGLWLMSLALFVITRMSKSPKALPVDNSKMERHYPSIISELINFRCRFELLIPKVFNRQMFFITLNFPLVFPRLDQNLFIVILIICFFFFRTQICSLLLLYIVILFSVFNYLF